MNVIKTNWLKVIYIKQTVILAISSLVSLLISVPRILSFYDITDQVSNSFSESSYLDITVRFLFIFSFSWLVLQYNSNWRYHILFKTKWKKIVFVILSNSVLSYLGASLLLFTYPLIVGQEIHDFEEALFYFIYMVVAAVLFFISGILRFQIIQKQDSIEKDQLRKESLENELMALKNQINPHFLFNSLNSLNSLVRENDAATKFINKLSFMYRYILQNGDQDLVLLEGEVKFLESYIYLIKTRYRDRVVIDIQIDKDLLSKKIPPLGIQTLVENAVKHNEISQNHPLLVKVYTDNECICVENKIRLRKTLAEGTGNGLSNLDKRYYLLKKEHILISDENGIFKVKYGLI